MIVFLDTEFTDFVNTDLISIGLVSEDGQEFYGENMDYISAFCSDWVRANIIPTLDFVSHGHSRLKLNQEVYKWLDSLATHVTILGDHRYDLELIESLLDGDYPVNCIDTPHDRLRANNVFSHLYHKCDNFCIRKGMSDIQYMDMRDQVTRTYKAIYDGYFIINKDQIQHNALNDARAIRKAYFETVKKYGL